MWRCLSSNLLWGGALEIFFDFNFPANSDQQNNHQWLHYILRAPKLNQAAIGLLMRLSESWRCTSQADSILNVWHGAPITWPPISIMLRLLKRWTKDRFIKPPLFNSGGCMIETSECRKKSKRLVLLKTNIDSHSHKHGRDSSVGRASDWKIWRSPVRSWVTAFFGYFVFVLFFWEHYFAIASEMRHAAHIIHRPAEAYVQSHEPSKTAQI